jgi:DNA polymerase-3 subunit epsilon
MKPLPAKYYLDHFNEFLSFVVGPSQQLLGQEDLTFIDVFNSLNEDAKCVFVRTINRKSPIIKIDSLAYQEISAPFEQVSLLKQHQMIRSLAPSDCEAFWFALTKPQLCILLKLAQVEFKSSQNKAALVDIAKQRVPFDLIKASDLYELFVVRNCDQCIDYLLFLFFGDLNSRLNKFSMRDLGVMRTRKSKGQGSARFDTLEDAKSTYLYKKRLQEIADLAPQQILKRAEKIESLPKPSGQVAETAKDKYFYHLGKALVSQSPEQAIAVWEQSNYPQAQEKWLREQYKLGNIDLVKTRLLAIINEPESEGLLVFAEDFLARKYDKKRTSILTDMLRQGSQQISIDEMYSGSVEYGVTRFYQKQGQQAFRTENSLWRSLFGLTFWHELYELDASALATEFDTRPKVLRNNNFYQQFEDQIEDRLLSIPSADIYCKLLSKNASKHYGKKNSILKWHSALLEQLTRFINFSSLDSILNHMRAMTKDYHKLSDGYPDIMVIENQQLRFEEVKAPGDQLRKNQLLTIRHLRDLGFDVRISKVDWFIDPQQAYVVVDIETTGGKSDQHRITEIGMVKMINGERVDYWQSLINPQRHIPRFITQLTGIDDEMVVNAPLFCEVSDNLLRFLEGSVFVAHNVGFDYGFFKREFERIGHNFRMPKLCTVREMRKAKPGLKSYSLANLTDHFDIAMTQHHRALSDAEAAAELLMIINEHRMSYTQKDDNPTKVG